MKPLYAVTLGIRKLSGAKFRFVVMVEGDSLTAVNSEVEEAFIAGGQAILIEDVCPAPDTQFNRNLALHRIED